MITKVNVWKEDGTLFMEFPELKTIDMQDEDVQKYIIRYGGAVGVPGSLIFTQSVELIAGGKKE